MLNKGLSIAGLAVLAAGTVGLVALAMMHVRPRAVTALPEPAPISASSTEAPVGAPPAPPEAAPSGSPTAVETPRPRTAAAVKQVMAADAAQVVVLGDDTGADVSGWVDDLAADLGRTRAVTLIPAGGPERSIGSGARTVTLHNASARDLTVSGAATQASALVPSDTQLVVLSFGHRESAAQIPGDLDRLLDALPAQAAVLVVIQNPEKGPKQQPQRDRTRAVSEWAQQNKLPTADVYQAFTAAPEPLADLLQKDSVTPSADGAQLFARTVGQALG